MSLPESLRPTFAAALLSDLALAQWRTDRRDDLIEAYYNAPSDPAFILWRTSVTNEEIGDAFNGTEIAGLASLPMQRIQVLAAMSNGTQNPSRFDRRDAFDRIFSGAGGANTRAALAVIWRRFATRAEVLFATGLGSDASPATPGWQGAIPRNLISTILNEGS